MSPSWISSSEIFLNSSRIRPVLRKSRCRSSTKIKKMRPAASLVGRDGGSRMPSCGRRRRRRRDVVDAAAVGQRERDDLLLHAVFEDLEIVFLQVGDELAAVVADDDVGGDEIDARADDLLAGPRAPAARAAASASAPASAGPASSVNAHIVQVRSGNFACMARLYRAVVPPGAVGSRIFCIGCFSRPPRMARGPGLRLSTIRRRCNLSRSPPPAAPPPAPAAGDFPQRREHDLVLLQPRRDLSVGHPGVGV